MKPNILIMMSDQHSGRVMGHAGADVDTPHLDALARMGTGFDNAYTPCPLCVPARMSFVSGLSAGSTGVMTNADTLPDVTPTFLHTMVAAGYETVLIGRMHFVGDEQRHGFTKRLALDFTPTTWARPQKLLRSFRGAHAVPVYFAALDKGLGGGESCVTFYDRMVTEAALKYLAEPHDKPQCVVVGTYGPHFPYTAPKELYEKYKARLKLHPDFRQWQPEFETPMTHRNMEAPEDRALAAMAAYYALVEVADGQIGAVWQAFRDMCAREGRERFFLYLSDHGDMNGHKGIYGKQVLFEDSVKIPMIAEGDGIPAGRRVRDNVSLLDVAPTVCELGGARPLEEFEGRSLTGYFQPDYQPDRERTVVSELFETRVPHEYRWAPTTPEARKHAVRQYGVMLRRGRFKYIVYRDELGNLTELLYDLEADPDENENVLERFPDEAKELREYALGVRSLESVLTQQAVRARNAALFTAYDLAVGNEKGEMWTDNPPEGRLAPEI